MQYKAQVKVQQTGSSLVTSYICSLHSEHDLISTTESNRECGYIWVGSSECIHIHVGSQLP